MRYAALVLLVSLTLVGCDSDDDVPPAPDPTETTTMTPLVATETYQPAGCVLPPLVIERDIQVSLFHTKAQEPLAGVSLTSLQSAPGGSVVLVVERTAEGCTGTSEVNGDGDQDVQTLGMTLHVRTPIPSPDTPNRATTPVTIKAG